MIRSGDKRLLNMMILEILQQYTDQNHRLGQSEILSLLQENYGVTCSRKTLYNNLQALREAGYEISTDGAAGGTCLLSRTLEDPELYMLIDSVLFSRTLSHREAGNLIIKLEAMGSPSFHKNTAHICSLPYLQHSDNEQVMKNIDVISQAITKHRKIRFIYSSYGTDFRLHPRKAEPVLYNPYQIAADNGRFYLIGNVDRYGDVSHYRVDRMSQVEELKDPAKPMREVEGLENGLSLPKHMAEHLYMFSGSSVHAVLDVPESMMDELVDWFGRDFRIVQSNGDRMGILVSANEEALFCWSLQYGPDVEVKSPEKLRTRLRTAAEKMAEKYQRPEKETETSQKSKDRNP